MTIKRTTLTTGSLLLLLTLLLALLVLSNTLLRGVRLDLTENGLYTLSDGTRNTLAALDEPINLYFFFSEEASRDYPPLRTYATRVHELLEEYALRAGGKIKLNVIDPKPFSEDEDRAAGFGLQAVPTGVGEETLYFGLAGTNSVDGVATIPFFQPEKEAFLEYDLSKLVYSLAHPKKPVLGLLTALPMQGGFDFMARQPSASWVVMEQLQSLFDVRPLDPATDRIDPAIDVLLVAHPKGVSAATLYAIDQYVLGGGKAMVFVDPLADIEQPPTDPNNPMAAMMADRSSDLAPLLAAWGVSYDPAQVVLDSRYALAVSSQPGQYPVQHVGIFGLDQQAFAANDVIMAQLHSINLALPGFLKARDGATTTLEPLLTSSESAMTVPVDKVRFVQDPRELQKGFAPTGERYVLAARVQGPIKSAYPNGRPTEAPAAASPESGQEPEKKAESAQPAPLSAATGPVNLIVVADVDVLADRLWVQSQDFLGQRIATAFANNGDFVFNALDNLTGNSDLIGIRGQAVAARPFTTVAALEREANAQFLATEQQLEQQLHDTEQRLAALQQNRTDNHSLLLTPEQQAEIDSFQQKKLEIRRQLREVQRSLDEDIETLGTVLKIINIGLVPLLLSIAALFWWVHNNRRRGAQKVVLS